MGKCQDAPQIAAGFFTILVPYLEITHSLLRKIPSSKDVKMMILYGDLDLICISAASLFIVIFWGVVLILGFNIMPD